MKCKQILLKPRFSSISHPYNSNNIRILSACHACQHCGAEVSIHSACRSCVIGWRSTILPKYLEIKQGQV